MTRTVDDVERDIEDLKAANPQWRTDGVVLALITEYMKEKNGLQSKISNAG